MTDPGTDDPEAFVDNLPLTALFGTHPKARIVGAMLTGDADPPTAFSPNEISRIAGVEETTVEEHLADLVDLGIAREADEPGVVAYRLDEESDAVDRVRRLNDDLAKLVFRAEG